LGGSVSKASLSDPPLNGDWKSSPTYGFDLGVMGAMRVHKNFVLNIQLNYSNKGKVIDGTNGAGRSDDNAKLNARMQYIEMPIFYVLEFKNLTGKESGKGGRTKTYDWFLGAGPTISYWMGTRGTLQSSYLKENLIESLNYTGVFGFTEDLDKEIIEDANRFQFAINITGGLAFEPAVGRKVVTALSFNIAQSWLAATDGQFPISFVDSDPMKIKNHSLRLSVAYLFDANIQNRKKGKSTIKNTRPKGR